jgi:hypothetical protein
MGIFNRVLVTLFAVCLLVLAAALGAAPQATLGVLEQGLSSVHGVPQPWVTALAALVAALALIVLVVEWRPQRRAVVRTQLQGGATLEYDRGTVGAILERELAKIDGVRGARVQVMNRQGHLDAYARIAVAEGHDSHDVANRAASRIREALQHGLGIELNSLRLAVTPGLARGGAKPAPVMAAHTEAR